LRQPTHARISRQALCSLWEQDAVEVCPEVKVAARPSGDGHGDGSASSAPKRVATIKKVAHRAGVSIATVSRTFADPASVSDELRVRVHEAGEQGHLLTRLRDLGQVPAIILPAR